MWPIIAASLTRPQGTPHWSTRRLAKQFGVSASTVARVWQEGRLKPQRVETFRYSSDPDLVARVTGVVGLYLHPPARANVLSVDEKTQIEALDRTQPTLPLRPGQVARHAHDHRRNGTTSLFAALEAGTGRVTNQTRERHTGDDFLAFLRLLARTYPRREVHVILDDVSTHRTPDMQRWLARHRRFTREWNAGAAPFSWVKTTDEILARAVRKAQAESGARH